MTPSKPKAARGGPPAKRTAPGVPLVQRLTEQVDKARLPYRLGFAGLGALAGIYLTIQHFTATAPLGCAEGALINCTAVLSSPESSIFGVPVAVLGLVFFLVYLASLYARTRVSSPRQSAFALAWALGGALVVIALVYTELFVVRYICLWCSFTHLMALGVFALEIWPISAGEDLRADARRRARQTAAAKPARH